MAAAHRFKVYYGPDSDAHTATCSRTDDNSQKVTVALAEVLPLLADAVNARRTWLNDFAQDEISISTDLYEVILAYQHHLRPGA